MKKTILAFAIMIIATTAQTTKAAAIIIRAIMRLLTGLFGERTGIFGIGSESGMVGAGWIGDG